MKLANLSKGVVLGLTILLATSLFAANSNKGQLATLNAITVNGKALPAGNYNVEWTGTGSNVQVNILKGKEVVATAPASLVTLAQSSDSNAAVAKDNGDGTRTLSQIRFGGKKYALQFGGDDSSMEASGSSK